MSAPGIGDTVQVYAVEIVNARVVGGCWQPGTFVIVRENRHGDWTVRHVPTGATHDVRREHVRWVTS